MEDEIGDNFEYELPNEDDFHDNQENFHSDYEPEEKKVKQLSTHFQGKLINISNF